MTEVEGKSHAFLKDYCIADLVFEKRKLIAVTEEATIADALAKLAEHNILALPIVDTKGSFVDIVTILDIMTYVAFGSLFDSSDEDLEALESSEFKLTHQPVSKLCGMSEGEDLWVLEPSMPLEKALEPFSKGVHRALVFQKSDVDNKSVGRLVTQSDVVRFLTRHMTRLGDWIHKAVEEQGLVEYSKELVTVSENTPTVRAFQTMRKHQLSAVPVVDANGKIVTQLSASDLRGLTAEDLHLVGKPVVKYLRARRGGRVVHPVTCTAKAPLSTVMLQAAAGHVHRVWVVDSTQQPFAVVTLSDIICKFSPFDHH